jgi:hypothetical protein
MAQIHDQFGKAKYFLAFSVKFLMLLHLFERYLETKNLQEHTLKCSKTQKQGRKPLLLCLPQNPHLQFYPN